MKNKILICLCAACGVGKSTIKDYINEHNLLPEYAAIDTDEVGLNWWDYADTDNPDKYTTDSISKAFEIANGKNLLFASCLNPLKFYDIINIPDDISESYLIGMACSDEEITKRLKARPAERMCGNNEFIERQIEYNNWFKGQAGKMQFFIDNTNMNVIETAEKITEYIKRITP